MNDSNFYSITENEQARVDFIRNLAGKGPKALPELLELLSDSSWVVRRVVVESLAGMGNPAVEALAHSLKYSRQNETKIAAMVDALVLSSGQVEVAVDPLAEDSDPAVVADVAQILGRRKKQSSTRLLVKLTLHENDNVAVGAIEALGRVGGRAAIEALITSIESGNFFRTFPAIDVLGRSGDPRVVEPLTKLLKNPNYLPEASRALGRTGERSAMKPLLELLNSASDAVVRIAAIALSELQDQLEEKAGTNTESISELLRIQVSPEVVRRLARMLPDTDSLEAVALCKFLGLVGNAEAAPQLTSRLDGIASVAESAANALKKMGQTADAHLRLALREGQSARRKVLLPVVSRSAAAEDVAICLSDSDPDVRVLACETLSRLGVAHVVPSLFKLLGDTNLRVVHAATSAVQALGSREARLLAVEAARSPLPGVRRSALNILAYFGDSTATAPMLAGLEDADGKVREAALQGLPLLEDSSAHESLFESARDEIPRMRSLAMRAIGQLPKAGERALSVLLKALNDSDAWVRYYACQSLGRLRYASAVPEIAALLRDEAGQVRVSAVEALSHLDTPDAHLALRNAVRSGDSDVKRAALVGLGMARRGEDLSIVLSEVNSPDAPTRLLALSALVNFPSPHVFSTLSNAASDSDEQVRSAAIGFLAARPEQEATVVLVNLLSQEFTREKAKYALSVSSTGRLGGILIALESANDELAPLLISILVRLGPSDVQTALLSAAKLNNVPARKAAVTAMSSYLNHSEIHLSLEDAALHDSDREVRQIASLLLQA